MRVRGRNLAQILVTALALFFICQMVPWRDRAYLPDGTTAIILDRDGTSLTIQAHGLGEEAADSIASAPRNIPIDDVQSIEPGVASLIQQAQWPWLGAYLACVSGAATLLILRWKYLLTIQCQPEGAPPPEKPDDATTIACNGRDHLQTSTPPDHDDFSQAPTTDANVPPPPSSGAPSSGHEARSSTCSH